jgi:hypothetical protein
MTPFTPNGAQTGVAFFKKKASLSESSTTKFQYGLFSIGPVGRTIAFRDKIF